MCNRYGIYCHCRYVAQFAPAWIFFCNASCSDLLKHLDLVALATICDVVPLVGLNRAFVRQGLKGNSVNILGLPNSLILLGLMTSRAYALGFLLGPRINAAGQLGASIWG